MITMKKLREFLAQFPDDALVYAFEAEVTGIVVKSGKKEWLIEASSWDDPVREGRISGPRTRGGFDPTD